MKVSVGEIGILATYAIHDVMGRESFVPDKVRSIVLPLLPELTDGAMRMMRDQCRWQRATDSWGHQKGEWVAFAREVEAECERRGI